MWAAIKFVINSTLGTSNFKPLDEVVLSFLKKYVNTTIGTNYFRPLDDIYQMHFEVSEEILFDVETTQATISNNEIDHTYDKKIFFETSGKIKVKFPVKVNIANSSTTYKLEIFCVRNGTSETLYTGQSTGGYFREITIDELAINKGDTIQFKVKVTRVTGTRGLSIDADGMKSFIVYASLVETPELAKII